jgi:IclR family acetate operon transcriptional repressor
MLGYQAPAVQKAFLLLNTVAEAKDGMRLTDISRGLGFSKGTTHGLIQALLKVGALYQSPFQKKVFLGASFVNLAIKSGHYNAITTQAQPLIDVLCTVIGHSVFLGILSESGITVIATARASNSLAISSSPGSKIPFIAGAVSKAYLASLSNPEALDIIREKGLDKYTPLSIVDEREYLETLNTVRLNGYAVDDGEYIAGVKSIAMNLDRFRNLPLLMWVVGFSSVIPKEKTDEIVHQMKRIAKKVKTILN